LNLKFSYTCKYFKFKILPIQLDPITFTLNSNLSDQQKSLHYAERSTIYFLIAKGAGEVRDNNQRLLLDAITVQLFKIKNLYRKNVFCASLFIKMNQNSKFEYKVEGQVLKSSSLCRIQSKRPNKMFTTFWNEYFLLILLCFIVLWISLSI
jgi:hypothetical protein